MTKERRPEVKENDTEARIFKPWKLTQRLAEDIAASYSVTSPEQIKNQYIKQVEQYPLYNDWLEWVYQEIDKKIQLGQTTRIIEYGSGPGLLAKKIKKLPDHEYTAVEPNIIFRQTTKEAHPFAKVVDGTAEKFQISNNAPLADLICATATYHHFKDKRLAVNQMYQNLKPGGSLLIGDVFLPKYAFDNKYNPTDRQEFLKSNITYAAKQIHYMQNPDLDAIEDQLKTFVLDTVRHEELKVCLDILLNQLDATGFQDILCTEMPYKGQEIGWYKVQATKPLISQL